MPFPSPDRRPTTAGWIAEPADKTTWLAGLAEHRLDEFDLPLLAVRRFGNVAVVLVESVQKGSPLIHGRRDSGPAA